MTEQFDDVTIEIRDGRGIITIDRPEVMNAFRAQTIDELIAAMRICWVDPSVGVVVLTGAGDRAFCTGGDVNTKTSDGYAGDLPGPGIDIDTFNYTIRAIPKPVIAAVNGYAIGGGNIIQLMCDLSIASDRAIFGQVGPKVGSVDAGFGTAYLARVIGERKAREFWFLCRRYSADEALGFGLVNCVVPHERLFEEAMGWCDEVLRLSPTALRLAKQSFDLDTEMIAAFSRFAMSSVDLFYKTPEAHEGASAFGERRPADFARFRR